MKWIIAAVVALGFLTSTDSFAASYPRIAEDTPYEEARDIMMAAGFSAAATAQPDDCALGREDICQKWPETESCAGTGMGLCSFAWKKGATVVEIVTVGDETIVVRRARCRSGC